MLILGIDLGGTTAKCGIVSGGRIIKKASCPTAEDSNYTKILSDIIEICQETTKGYEIAGMGIGSPGLIDSDKGIVCWSNNIRWKERNLKADLERELGLEAKITNDAKCAALGEAIYGAGKKLNSALVLTLGTGVGGGFVRKGKIAFETIHDYADSIFGHITVEANGRLCTCGRKGCLESYVSSIGLCKNVFELTGEKLTAREIFNLARDCDSVMKPIVDEFMFYLGVGAVSLANAYRPEVIIIGGGISDAADMILPRLNETLEKEVFGYKYAPVKAVKAVLGQDAGIVGAAALYRGVIDNDKI